MRGMLARAAVGATFVATTGVMVAVALPADAASGGSGGANRASRTPASSTGLSDSAARSRTRAAFPDFVDEKGWADLQDEPGTDVERYVGDKAAVVKTGGRRALVRSLLPLRTGEGGDQHPVDTDLSEQAGRLRPAQPLSEYFGRADARHRIADRFSQLRRQALPRRHRRPTRIAWYPGR